ncbi:hypothetical protein GW932_05225 [archaeon]|nr:hypothetical protein [archaeon]
MKLALIGIFIFLISFVFAETTFFEGGQTPEYILSKEKAVEKEYVCGDLVCDFNESCESCNLDCGNCSIEEKKPSISGNIVSNNEEKNNLILKLSLILVSIGLIIFVFYLTKKQFSHRRKSK